MISFCKSGMLVLEDSNGVLHYIDPNHSLRDVAAYIWKNASLNQYKVESHCADFSGRRTKYIDKASDESHRLRFRSVLKEDTYFTDCDYLHGSQAAARK